MTKRESEIIKMIAWGAASKEIADILCISTRTVEKHIESIKRKKGLGKSTELSACYFCEEYDIPKTDNPLLKCIVVLIISSLIGAEYCCVSAMPIFVRVVRVSARRASRRSECCY